MTVARRKAAQAKRGKAELNPHDALVLLTADHNEIGKLALEDIAARRIRARLEDGEDALGWEFCP